MIKKRRHIAERLATAWGVTVDEVKDFYPGRGESVSRAPPAVGKGGPRD